MASLGAYLEALAIQRKFPHLLMLSGPIDWIHFLLEELVGSMVWWEQILKTIILLLEDPTMWVCMHIHACPCIVYVCTHACPQLHRVCVSLHCLCVLVHVPIPSKEGYSLKL